MSETMPKSVFRTALNHRRRLSYVNVGESATKQSFKDECDINVIMKRYEQSGVLQHLARGEPQYVDASSLDYQASMELVVAAREQFMALPSRVRERFQNDPAQMLAFVEDRANLDEARELGLVPPKVEERVTPVRIIPDVKADVK